MHLPAKVKFLVCANPFLILILVYHSCTQGYEITFPTRVTSQHMITHPLLDRIGEEEEEERWGESWQWPFLSVGTTQTVDWPVLEPQEDVGRK